VVKKKALTEQISYTSNALNHLRSTLRFRNPTNTERLKPVKETGAPWHQNMVHL